MQGKVLGGRYKIISHLGGGGFGQTYLAQDYQLPDTPECVVKQFKPLVADASTLAVAGRLFDREARILHKLGCHDQIPRLLAHFEEDNEFYLVQEYIEGNTLAQEIHQSKQLSQAEVIFLLQDILSTLEYVHQQNVIHRDIKPSNLIRRKQDGKIVLIDFGAVKQISQQGLNEQGQTGINTTISTKGYTPFEQLEGYPQFNSDIYALGITAIQALTGIQPKHLQRDFKTGQLLWREQVEVIDEFAAVLDKMVHTNSRERYQSVGEVVNDLRRMMNSSEAPTEALPNSSEAPTVALPNISEAPTVAGPEVTTEPLSTSKATKYPSSVSSKPGALPSFKSRYILAALATISALLGGLELIYPIFRPIYYLHRGEQLLELQKPQEALENFQKLTEGIKPKDPQAWKGKGNALFKLERYEGAMAAYDKALQFNPNDSKVLNNKGRLLYETGRYQEALDVYEQAIKIVPDNALAWNGKGLALIGLHRYQESLDAFDKAKTIQPQDPTVWQSKGLALEYLQRKQEAIKVYEEALAVYNDTVKKKPNDPTAWTDRGTVVTKFQRFPEALDSYEKALKINPNFYEALFGKANALASLQRYDEALNVYEQVIKNNPDDSLAWHNRGELLAQGKKDYKEAIKSYEKSLEFKPEFYPAWLGKGLALTSLKQYTEALTAFDKAIDIEANDAFVWANRGFVLEKMGQKQEAIASYKKAIQIDPKFQQAFDALEQLQR
jgi:tetratricopeptide (TPR) repeat protein